MKFNKVHVSSLSNQFASYTLENVVAINVVKKVISITYIDKNDMSVNTAKYESEDIVLNFA